MSTTLLINIVKVIAVIVIMVAMKLFDRVEI
jgi:hypothetical protein